MKRLFAPVEKLELKLYTYREIYPNSSLARVRYDLEERNSYELNANGRLLWFVRESRRVTCPFPGVRGFTRCHPPPLPELALDAPPVDDTPGRRVRWVRQSILALSRSRRPRERMLRGSPPAPLSRPSPSSPRSRCISLSWRRRYRVRRYREYTHPRSTLARNTTRPRPFAIFHLCIISVKTLKNLLTLTLLSVERALSLKQHLN